MVRDLKKTFSYPLVPRSNLGRFDHDGSNYLDQSEFKYLCAYLGEGFPRSTGEEAGRRPNGGLNCGVFWGFFWSLFWTVIVLKFWSLQLYSFMLLDIAGEYGMLYSYTVI